MQHDQHASNRTIPFRTVSPAPAIAGHDDSGKSGERKKNRDSSSQLDPSESVSGRRPARSEENTPRYRR